MLPLRLKPMLGLSDQDTSLNQPCNKKICSFFNKLNTNIYLKKLHSFQELIRPIYDQRIVK